MFVCFLTFSVIDSELYVHEFIPNPDPTFLEISSSGPIYF